MYAHHIPGNDNDEAPKDEVRSTSPGTSCVLSHEWENSSEETPSETQLALPNYQLNTNYKISIILAEQCVMLIHFK